MRPKDMFKKLMLVLFVAVSLFAPIQNQTTDKNIKKQKPSASIYNHNAAMPEVAFK
ncbi:MAG: hypothetical protein IPG48_15905 [Saprospiraceae bacterium]|nr:hypothetical protein [Saprospiraceae bacterium]MBK6667579.1 hypothetical protein [Saprospiraceae bacterium]MBK7697788.1 hypothetical protein [Saprospiraceae bacterium]MBK8827244.1 hypothetical protein [Saprospiraceae bacterium]MBP6539407.1 hypothetical protein [Saprospiraceae bacterium]